MSFSLPLRRRAPIQENGRLPDNDDAALYAKHQTAQRATWDEWIAAPLKWLRPTMIVLVVSLLLNVKQSFDYSSLAKSATSVAPVVVVVDPTKTRVLQTITLDPATFKVDQEAETKMVRDFLTDAFTITTDPRRGRQQKLSARGRMVDASPGLTKMDGWWAIASHDPITGGENGWNDVTDIQVTPLLGDHRWSVQWTMQPYDLNGHTMPAYSMKGELSLQVILPKTKDQADTYYPYTFVRDFSFDQV